MSHDKEQLRGGTAALTNILSTFDPFDEGVFTEPERGRFWENQQSAFGFSSHSIDVSSLGTVVKGGIEANRNRRGVFAVR